MSTTVISMEAISIESYKPQTRDELLSFICEKKDKWSIF